MMAMRRAMQNNDFRGAPTLGLLSFDWCCFRPMMRRCLGLENKLAEKIAVASRRSRH